MVELKQLPLGQTSALGVHLLLPRGEFFFIIKDHKVVCDSSINVEEMVKNYPLLWIIQCERANSFASMLDQKIIHCSHEAIKQGVCLSMRIQDALILL